MNEIDRLFKRFCLILHICANEIRTYAGDILIDLPDYWNEFKTAYLTHETDYPIITVRKTGSDGIKRFETCLKEGGTTNPTLADCLNYAAKTLGWDFALEILPDKVNIINHKLDAFDLRQLECRLRDYTETEVVTMVETTKVEDLL